MNIRRTQNDLKDVKCSENEVELEFNQIKPLQDLYTLSNTKCYILIIYFVVVTLVS